MNLSIGFAILGAALLILGLEMYGITERAALLAGVLIGVVFGSPVWMVLIEWSDVIYPDPGQEGDFK